MIRVPCGYPLCEGVLVRVRGIAKTSKRGWGDFGNRVWVRVTLYPSPNRPLPSLRREREEEEK